MSLKDTIRGAREEAAANVKSLDRNAKDEAKQSDVQDAKSGSGFTRASAASGKPAREAAAGVRKVTATGKPKSKRDMSKEERKAERRREQEIEDQRYTLSQAVLKDNEEYNRLHKVWMRFLIVGIVLMVMALSFYGLVSQQGETAPAWLAIAALVSMIGAYIAIIAGMVYDWRKIKPIRDQVGKRVSSMSVKRVRGALAKRAGKE